MEKLWHRLHGLWTRAEAVTHRAWWTGPRIAVAAILTLAGVHVAVDWATLPPPLPSHRTTVAGWKPSEAWLYDREGRLLDSSRVDFQARRLAWTPLDKISPEAVTAIAQAEDRRFRDHDGVDWWAVAGAIRDRLEGRRARGGVDAVDAGCGLFVARSCRAGIARVHGQAAPDARGGGAGTWVEQGSDP
ncbi:transglycosylase domain-containing protein [Sphingomonas sp. J315]|uniref:transglycosylase domain-containing protein n=1 Tax=Sphingomonas sp. J315 TaxID=2898433 RepID=UPI0028A1ABF0|nr:transglycosylase domain-containing protein [Sphingomonas sp. J315]